MHKKELKYKVFSLFGIVLLMLVVGTFVFSYVEKWSLLDSFYFAVMTATTVGYGDLYPTHALSKIVTVVYALSIIPLFLYSFSMIARYQVQSVYRKIRQMEINQKEQIKRIEKEKQLNQKLNREINEQEKALESVERKLGEKK